jgi:hypothetical protein
MDPVTARIEALEFMAAFGLLAYAGDYHGSGWDQDRLAQFLVEQANAKGVTVPTGEAWDAVLHIIEATAKLR